MSIEKNVQVVKDFFAAMGSGDTQAVGATCYPLLKHSLKCAQR